MKQLAVAVFLAFILSVLVLAWLSLAAPASDWECSDVPCSEAAQCPPTCSTCDFDEDAGEMRCQR